MSRSALIKDIEGQHSYLAEDNVIVISSGRIVLSDGTTIVCSGGASSSDKDATGDIAQTFVDILPFEVVEIHSAIKVYFTQGEKYECEVEGPSGIIQHIMVENDDSVLKIMPDASYNDSVSGVSVKLKAPRLAKVDTWQSSQFVALTDLNLPGNLELVVHQSSGITMQNIKSATIVINIIQAGRININAIESLTATVIKVQEAGSLTVNVQASSPSYSVFCKHGARVDLQGVVTEHIFAQTSDSSSLILSGKATRAEFASQGASFINAQRLDADIAKVNATEISQIDTSVSGNVERHATLIGKIIGFIKKKDKPVFF